MNSGEWISFIFLKVDDDLFGLVDIQGEIVLVAPHSPILNLSPVGTLVVVTDKAYDRGALRQFY